VLSPKRERLEFGGRIFAHGFDAGDWGTGADFVRSDAPIKDASSNWLSYSRYDGIILLATDLEKMSAPAQTALWQYTECGGSLLVLGKGRVPESWRTLPRDKQPGYTHYRPGFGDCIVIEDANAKDWRDLQSEWRQTAIPWGQRRSALEANRTFPIVNDIGIPVRGLFVLLVCFGIVIGPVNLGLLARWKRRIWMLWTVPLLSALTCAAVFGYMILAEGWSGHLRTEAITILDQSSGRAATVGWTGFYSPVTPGNGLRFDHDTELTLQAARNRYGYERYERGGGSFMLDWTDGQHLSKGWVTARVPTHFLLRKSELRRERVTWAENADGTLSITNGLGAAIKKFWLADGRGRLHTAGPVEPGATAVLSATGTDLAGGNENRSWRYVYGSDWLTEARQLRATPDRYLSPWTYLADVDGTPFVEDGLPGAKRENCRSLVVGILKGGGQ